MMSVALSLLSSRVAAAMTYDCKHIRVDRQSFDLSPLSGDHSVSHIDHHPPILINTTYTLNICGPLERKSDVPQENQCPSSTRICAIERELNDDGAMESQKREKQHGPDGTIIGVIPIAGEFIHHHGGRMDPKWTRLKTSSSNSDSEKEGLRLELHGGRYPFSERHGRKQKAIIEFICDHDRTGLEGLGGDSGKADAAGSSLPWASSNKAVTFDDDDDDDDDDNDDDDDGGTPPEDDDDDDNDKEDDDGKSLRFIRYEPTDEDAHEDTLRLEWRTKYACEGIRDEEGEKKGTRHWGFFTWFIIM